MIGMIADFPVLDLPVMTLIALGTNGTILGAKFPKRGHKIIDFIQKIMIKSTSEVLLQFHIGLGCSSSRPGSGLRVRDALCPH